jgi:hypothetical protein
MPPSVRHGAAGGTITSNFQHGVLFSQVENECEVKYNIKGIVIVTLPTTRRRNTPLKT